MLRDSAVAELLAESAVNVQFMVKDSKKYAAPVAGLDHHASAERSSGRALDRLSHVPLRSRKVWNVTYSSGMTKMPTALAAIIPVKTGVPTSCRLIWAAPRATTSG